eukprot:scaffold107199_cov33-Prasinocladus_malaysianus.AAC.1
MRRLPELSEIGNRPRPGATVIVTGPTSGIGTETAAEFARRGCNGAYCPPLILPHHNTASRKSDQNFWPARKCRYDELMACIHCPTWTHSASFLQQIHDA